MKVSVIIPAYNEAERIGAVIGAVLACPDADNVVVVDDGSEDDTVEAAKEYGVRVIALPKNVGKGGAMATAIAETDADVFVFIDADLQGLRPKHITALIKPLKDDENLMITAGRFRGGRLSTNLSQMVVPSINSQRAIRRSLLERVPDFSESRFGVETMINNYVKKNKISMMEIPLEGVAQYLKEEKEGLVKGVGNRAKMYGDIIKHRVPKSNKQKTETP